jgi:hypothetical protein
MVSQHLNPINHFNSHTLVIEFPAASISSANTPIVLFRKDNCPLEDVLLLKNTEPLDVKKKKHEVETVSVLIVLQLYIFSLRCL